LKITIESTDITTRLDGVPVRLWEGTTDQGVRCKVFIHRIAIANEADAMEFDEDLARQLPPAKFIPLTDILIAWRAVPTERKEKPGPCEGPGGDLI
jgi:hypothetical protein